MSIDVAVAFVVFGGVVFLVGYGIYQSRRKHFVAAEAFEKLAEMPGAQKTDRGVQFEFGLELWQDFYASSRTERLHGRMPIAIRPPLFYIGASASTTRYRKDLDQPFTARSTLPNVPITDDSMGQTLFLFSKQAGQVVSVLPYDLRVALARLGHEFDMWSEGSVLVIVATPLGFAGDLLRAKRIVRLMEKFAHAFTPPEPAREVAPEEPTGL